MIPGLELTMRLYSVPADAPKLNYITKGIEAIFLNLIHRDLYSLIWNCQDYDPKA